MTVKYKTKKEEEQEKVEEGGRGREREPFRLCFPFFVPDKVFPFNKLNNCFLQPPQAPNNNNNTPSVPQPMQPMHPGQTPHRTPLRRISSSSLFALSRSGQFTDAQHGLGFLEPAMAELVDETEALLANAEGVRRLGDSLARFNESFASFLYVLNMNALTTDWPQVSLSQMSARDVSLCSIKRLKKKKKKKNAVFLA